jgi:hypothetical protein
VPCPPDRKTIKSKWVYRIKKDSAGYVIKYKGRLCACGYSQIHDLEYHDVYSPVIRAEAVKLLFAIAASQDMEVHQMDVVSAFLNGDQEEIIYMQQPRDTLIQTFLIGSASSIAIYMASSKPPVSGIKSSKPFLSIKASHHAQ